MDIKTKEFFFKDNKYVHYLKDGLHKPSFLLSVRHIKTGKCLLDIDSSITSSTNENIKVFIDIIKCSSLDDYVFYFKDSMGLTKVQGAEIIPKSDMLDVFNFLLIRYYSFNYIDDYNLSDRTLRCLKENNIQTIGQLIQKSETEIKQIKNLGQSSFNEIQSLLESNNLSFGTKLQI